MLIPSKTDNIMTILWVWKKINYEFTSIPFAAQIYLRRAQQRDSKIIIKVILRLYNEKTTKKKEIIL